jgi:polar amino acid transport system substrate-binding protein
MIVSILMVACGGTSDKYQVATDATWPPFEVVDETTKEIIGFDIDLMEAIAERGGFEVEFVNVGWDPLLAGMAQCQYDAAISAMTITEERKKSFLFSDPYFEAGQIVTVLKLMRLWPIILLLLDMWGRIQRI